MLPSLGGVAGDTARGSTDADVQRCVSGNSFGRQHQVREKAVTEITPALKEGEQMLDGSGVFIGEFEIEQHGRGERQTIRHGVYGQPTIDLK